MVETPRSFSSPCPLIPTSGAVTVAEVSDALGIPSSMTAGSVAAGSSVFRVESRFEPGTLITCSMVLGASGSSSLSSSSLFGISVLAFNNASLEDVSLMSETVGDISSGIVD